jgi:DNA-binding NtrC family response regulator
MADEPRTLSSLANRALPKLVGATVRVLDGKDKGQRQTLQSGAVVVGTDESCALVLSDPKVSRRHCEIAVGPYGFIVKDLESRNGTFFEGSRVGQIAVPPGALVRVGETWLVLGTTGDAPEVVPSEKTSFGKLLGKSVAMRRVFTLLERAATTDATVLLSGETGTGKELAARAIHQFSARSGKPYEVLDCGAVATTLLTAELFGYRRGAFTGADKDHAGVFERADGGTVFLDEIGELPLETQAMLLRVCEDGTVKRLGSGEARQVDVRIIAATWKELPSEVVAGNFRQDLYYRLQVFPINLPPLRSRKDDLPLMCEVLLKKLGMSQVGPVAGPALHELMRYAWPGNVRQLRNVLERAWVQAGAQGGFADLRFDLENLPAPRGTPDQGASFQEQKATAVAEFEYRYLSGLMNDNQDNIKKASRMSGIERSQLKRLLRKHGLL